MGFGLMLAGYFALTFMSFAAGDYAFALYIIGGAVSFIAAGRLYEYKHRFGITVATSVAWLVLGVYAAVLYLNDIFLWEMPLPGMDETIPNMALFVLSILHTAGMLWAMYGLARQVGVEKIWEGIPWDFSFLGLWAIGQTVLLVFPRAAAFQDGTLTKIVLLIRLMTYLLVCWRLFRCYQFICPADEAERPVKRSRFSIVNKMNDKLEERSRRAAEESLEYHRQRAEQKKRKKKKK